jgi:hypothetical protein
LRHGVNADTARMRDETSLAKSANDFAVRARQVPVCMSGNFLLKDWNCGAILRPHSMGEPEIRRFPSIFLITGNGHPREVRHRLRQRQPGPSQAPWVLVDERKTPAFGNVELSGPLPCDERNCQLLGRRYTLWATSRPLEAVVRVFFNDAGQPHGEQGEEGRCPIASGSSR